MKFLKDIFVKVFDYNRNGKVEFTEFLLGSLCMLIYWFCILGSIISVSFLLGKYL